MTVTAFCPGCGKLDGPKRLPPPRKRLQWTPLNVVVIEW